MKPTRQEFEKLALEQLDTLYRVARHLTRDSAQAEDLVQETYLRALRGADGFNLAEFGIRPWLLRIMHNLHITRRQRDSRNPRPLVDDQIADIPHNIVALDLKDTAALFDGMDQQLVAALEELPWEYEQVMLLWAVDNLSYKEISVVLNVPIGTIMSRLHRARQRLALKLTDYAKEEGYSRPE
jgi:RNA polymerase sigma-70 factor (ECF subfamily)